MTCGVGRFCDKLQVIMRATTRALSILGLLCCMAVVPLQHVQAGQIEGFVLSAELGIPLEGVAVDVFGISDSTQFAQVVTNAEGRFRIANLGEGTYLRSLSKDGLLPEAIPVTLASDTDEVALDIPLRAQSGGITYENEVTGRILDADTDAPLEGITVVLDAIASPFARRTTSDADGAFRFRDLPPNSYVVSAGSVQYARAALPDSVVVADTSNISGLELRLTKRFEAFATIEGTVRSAGDGSPVEGAYVQIYSRWDANGSPRDSLAIVFETGAVTDANGAYRLENVVPGTYFFDVYADRYAAFEIEEISVADGEVLLRDVELAPLVLGSVSGQVTQDGTGAALPGVMVQLVPLDHRQSRWSNLAFTDDFGRYEVEAEPGSYLAFVLADQAFAPYWEYYDDAFDPNDATPITITANTNVSGIDFGVPNFDLPFMGTISGMVKDDSGAPLENVVVQAIDFITGLHFVAETDANGEYTITLEQFVPQVLVWAERVGFNPQFYPGRMMDHEAELLRIDPNMPDIAGIDFVLQRAPNQDDTTNDRESWVSGVALSDEGQPLLGAVATVYDVATARPVAYARADSSGFFAAQIPATSEDLRLLLTAEGYVPQYVFGARSWVDAVPVQRGEFVPPLPMVPLKASGGAQAITGQALLPDGQPATGALVMVQDSSRHVVAFAFTDADGTYYIDGLAEGRYTLFMDIIGFEPIAMDVDVTANAQGRSLVNATLTPAIGTSRDEEPTQPEQFRLAQNYPNPFNPSTTIRYTLAQPTNVTLQVVDVLGREVALLVDGLQPAGDHRVVFSAPTSLPSGMYFYRLDDGAQVATRTMLLLK